MSACVTGERSGGKQRAKKKKKRKTWQYPPTCIHLLCLHIFGCKYVYKKTCCPSQKLTLKPVNRAFTKFITVREGIAELSTHMKKQTKQQKVGAISLSTKYKCNGVEIVCARQILKNCMLL